MPAYDINEIPLTRLRVSKAQPREVFKEESLQELALSIKQYGILQPLIVKKESDCYTIVAGERRFRAAKMAGLASAPCLVKGLNYESSMAIALIENIQRENLNAIEEAKAYKRLMETFGFSQNKVANMVGKDRSSIANSLRLLKLPETVQLMLMAEKLTMGHAKALLGLAQTQVMGAMALKIINEDLSVRKTENLCKMLNKTENKLELNIKTIEGNDKSVFALEKCLAEKLGCKVLIKRRGDGFLVEAYYAGIKEFNHLLMVLGVEL